MDLQGRLPRQSRQELQIISAGEVGHPLPMRARPPAKFDCESDRLSELLGSHQDVNIPGAAGCWVAIDQGRKRRALQDHPVQTSGVVSSCQLYQEANRGQGPQTSVGCTLN